MPYTDEQRSAANRIRANYMRQVAVAWQAERDAARAHVAAVNAADRQRAEVCKRYGIKVEDLAALADD
jgi:hypothetical protein